MKTRFFLLALVLTISIDKAQAHNLNRNTHISQLFFESTGLFQTTEQGTSPDKISAFDPLLVMTSSFNKDGTLNKLEITEDLYAYGNKPALLNAVASCIHAQQAGGFSDKHPSLGEWEAHSAYCNLEGSSPELFARWLSTLSDEEKLLALKLEEFMSKILSADFAAGTYYFSLHAKTRGRKPASA